MTFLGLSFFHVVMTSLGKMKAEVLFNITITRVLSPESAVGHTEAQSMSHHVVPALGFRKWPWAWDPCLRTVLLEKMPGYGQTLELKRRVSHSVYMNVHFGTNLKYLRDSS